MRKRLLSLAILVLLVATAFAQTGYRKMIVDSAEWKTDATYCSDCNGFQGPPLTYFFTYYYKLEGDTLIDSVKYSLMYSSVYAACPACPPHSSGPLAFPYCEGYGRPGYYREDTLARKVYYYDMQRHRDNLTIDYSLNVGDSFYVSYGQGDHYPNHDSGYIYVDSIAWSNFQGDTVKTWYFTNPKVTTLYEPSIMLYEGRGFSYGFFLDYVFADGTGIAGQLSGYCKNSSCWSTCTPTGITDIHAGEYISLFPDPAVKTVFIQSDQAQFLSATLYNTEGKEIKQYYTPSLDIGELSPGLYIARIKTSGGYTFKRFVKTQ